MILKRLTVNNIRAYLGQSIIDFASDPVKNVTMIHGVNGAGKTSLFLALNWALYGDDVFYSGHLLNETLLRSASSGELVSGSVALEFQVGSESFFLSRGVDGHLVDGRVVEKQAGLEIYKIDSTGRSKIEPLPKQLIESLVPSAIRTFFFFDGDKIAEFTKPGRQNDIQITRAVNEVLRLDLLNRAASHLAQLAARVNKEIASKGSPRLKEISAEIEQFAAKIQSLVEDRQKAGLELASNAERLSEVELEFGKISEISARAQSRLEVERELGSLVAQRDSAKVELMKANVAAYSLPLSTVLADAEDYLEEKRARKQIPGNLKDQFLMDLLEVQKCICDRDLLPKTAAFAHIEKLLNETVPQPVQEMAQILSSDIKRLTKAQESVKGLIVRRLQALIEADSYIDKLQKERETLELSIAKSVSATIQDLNHRRSAISTDRERLQYEIGRLDDKIASSRRDREKLDEKFRLESEKEGSLLELRIEAKITADAARVFEEIREQLVSELKVDISAEATRIFKSFTWKVDFFKEIRIGDDYLIELFDEFGRDMRNVMSAGETQLLSLAFMLSMTAISDIQAPLVIDTPIARLDRTVRNNLLAALPDLTPQLVLFVTDSEMDATVRPVIENRVGRDYLLTFADGVSSVSSGGFDH